MDPISGYVAGKAIDIFVDKFKDAVIQRWSTYRSKRYFQSFLKAVSDESANRGAPADLNRLLEKCELNSDITSVLFDAYRRVALSTSKDIGPRIIGIITAGIVLDERHANEYEERMLMAAETLSDVEFKGFHSAVQSWEETLSKSGKDVVLNHDILRITVHTEQFDSSWPKQEANISPINLAEELGLWALKMKNIGILWDSTVERSWEYKEDSERHIDSDGSVREITWFVEMPKEYMELAELIARAQSALYI